MAYGISFYKPNTTVFDTTITSQTTAALINAKIADKSGNSASRAQVLEAFQGTSTAPILPTEANIRYWMGAGLGYKKQTFKTYYTSLYNSNSVYAASVLAGRAFEDNTLSPLTITQDANQNGYPSGSTKDPWGNNNTSFLLGIGTGSSAYDVLGSTTYPMGAVPSDYRLQGSMYLNGNTTFITASASSSATLSTEGDYTIEAWVYLTSNTRETSIISRLTSSTTINQLGFDLYINSTGYLVWELPPWETLTSSITVPINQWAHIAITYSTTYGRRLYVNGTLPSYNIFNNAQAVADAPVITKVTAFYGSAYSFLGYDNCISVEDASGFSLYDKIKFYGTVTGQAINTSEYTIVAIDYTRNLIDLYTNIYQTYTAFSCIIVRTRASTPARSASRRYVVAGSVSDSYRLYLDPQGTPMGYQSYSSGVAEQELVTGRAVNSYNVGDTVVFTGNNMRGGLSRDTYYYIAYVGVFAGGSNFGGYITLTTSLNKSWINGVYTYTPVYISYFTDYGQNYYMEIAKVGRNPSIKGGTALGTTNLLIGSTNNKFRTASNTYFKGFLGGVRMDNGYALYNGSSFTPVYGFSNVTSKTPLLLTSNDGEKFINTGGSTVASIAYNNISNTIIYSKFPYLGTAIGTGSSYTIVQGTRPYIGPSTNWCAEAWIYPMDHNGGIMGSGVHETNGWGLTLRSNGQVKFETPNIYISSTTSLPFKTWAHVAVSLNGSILRLFINGIQEAAAEITPQYFYPYSVNGFCYVGYHNGLFFIGAISNARLVNGSSVYTSNFIPSTTKPTAPRTAVLNAYASNDYGPVIPSELEQQTWMYKGFDNFRTVLFSSTDVTWNQVDSFYVNGNTTANKTYPACVNREILVKQTLIGTPDINRAYYANIITTNSSNGNVYVTGGTVDAYITVLMR